MNNLGGTPIMRHQKGVAPLLLVLILGLMLALGAGGVAFAHGERAQEGFLRLKTAAWQDVQFSTDKVKQGEKVVITREGAVHRTLTLPYGCALHPYDGKPAGTQLSGVRT